MTLISQQTMENVYKKRIWGMLSTAWKNGITQCYTRMCDANENDEKG